MVAGLPKEVELPEWRSKLFGGGSEKEVGAMKAARSFKLISLVAAFLIAVVTISYGASLHNDFPKDLENKNTNLNLKQSELAAKVKVKNPEEFQGLDLKSLRSDVKDFREKTKKDQISKSLAFKETNQQQVAEVVKKSLKKTVKSAVRTNSKTQTKITKSVKTNNSSAVKTTAISREEKIRIEQRRAEQILAYYVSKYPILKGVKIYVRDCPNDWEGCAYYTKGVILIDPDHKHSLEEIIAHEVKHIVDWRSDGKIDYNDYHK